MKFCNKKLQQHLLNGGKIKQKNTGFIQFREIWLKDGCLKFVSDDTNYQVTKESLTSNVWEIIPIKYDWVKIVKDKILCQFWDNNQETQTPCVGYLVEKVANGFRRCGDGYATWKNCAPVKIEQFNIAKDLKEYEK